MPQKRPVVRRYVIAPPRVLRARKKGKKKRGTRFYVRRRRKG